MAGKTREGAQNPWAVMTVIEGLSAEAGI